MTTSNNFGEMGLGVCSDLQDCKLEHYSLQVSCYRYLLEEWYGVNIKGCYLLQLFGGSYKTWEAVDHRTKIQNIFTDMARKNEE